MAIINPANPYGNTGGWTRPDLSEVANMKHRAVSLSSSLWGEDGKQTVVCSGVIEKDRTQLIVTIPIEEDAQSYFKSRIRPVDQLTDKITFYAEKLPDGDIDVDVYIVRAVDIQEETPDTFEWWLPEMTSNDEPEPYMVSVSSINTTSTDGYNAFNSDMSRHWMSTNMSRDPTPWIQFDFGKNTYVNAVKIVPTLSNQEYTPKVFSILGSNDGAKWTEIHKEDGTKYPQTIPYTEGYEFNFDIVKYRYYRLKTEKTYSSDSDPYVRILEIKFNKAEGFI